MGDGGGAHPRYISRCLIYAWKLAVPDGCLVVTTSYRPNRSDDDHGPIHTSPALPMHSQPRQRRLLQGYDVLGQRPAAQVVYAPHDSPLRQEQPSLELLNRRVPTIQTYSPTEGSEGTKVTVFMYTLYDPETPPPFYFSLMFGSHHCSSSVNRLEAQGQYFRYLLQVVAPPFSSTGWVDSEVPIYLRVGDESGQDIGVVEVGNFSYTFSGPEPLYHSPPITARKRKITAEPDPLTTPTKRASRQDLRSQSSEEIPTFSYSAAEGAAYQHYLQFDDASQASPAVFDYASPRAALAYGPDASSRMLAYPYSNPSAASVASLEHRTSRPPSWSSALSDVSSQASRSPAITASISSTRASSQQMVPPVGTSNPPLIRTSTIQHASSSAHPSMAAPPAGQSFNPYAMYPHKAVLKIQGDLGSMAENWALDEWNAKRRLVQFQRQQSGNTIYATFQPVSPSERAAHSICISCIWWEEKGECYVTSVDTIYLLESLVDVRFTVEEKNRIRRNLEGFRPLTVSKGKTDSEEFFKVIMGFPAPKPRNIEKDVKVFPWKILSHALKKIIGKYVSSEPYGGGRKPFSSCIIY